MRFSPQCECSGPGRAGECEENRRLTTIEERARGVNVKRKDVNCYMNVDRWIARWEGEGGAIPQIQAPENIPKEQAMPLRRILVPIEISSDLSG